MDSIPKELQENEHVHFDKSREVWIYEDDDGTEKEWSNTLSKWVPIVDDALIEAQQSAYSVKGVDESVPAAPVLARQQKKPKDRKRSASPGASDHQPQKKRANEESRNTAVYVTRLPRDPPATIDEIHQTFAKCGMILEDADGNPRIKLYSDEKGNFNGECLVVFLQQGSVDLALQLLDDTELRLGSGEDKMVVKVADWSHKHSSSQNANDNPSTENGNAKKGKKGGDPVKQRAQRRAEKQKSTLNDWRDEEDDPLPDENPQPPSRVVVLLRMFTLNELDEEPELSLELKEDVRDECETIGQVTNVVLYDKEPEGVMTVRFKDPIAAQACVLKMNGRYFGKRQIIAQLFDGSRRFKKSGGGAITGADDEEEEARRLEEFGKWLEDGGE